MFPFMGDAFFNPVPSVAQNFFSMDTPQRLFNSNRPINPLDAVRQIHQSMDEFMNRTARAFFTDFEALSEAAFRRSRGVVSGNDAPVPFHQNRQEWYELNVTRTSERSAPPSASAKRAIDVLDQLPVSIVRVKSTANNSASTSKQSTPYAKTSDAGALTAPSCGVEEQTATVREPGQTEFVLRPSRPRDRSINPIFPVNQLHPTATGGKPECEICLGEYAASDRVRHLPCGHLFHVTCIDTWLHDADTCPKCRKNILFGLRRLHTQHLREQRARAQSLTSAARPPRPGPSENSSAGLACTGRSASTSRPTELANRIPFHPTRTSILRSQLAEQRKNDALRPPPLPASRSRRDQQAAGVSRPVPARRTQTPTNQRAPPSAGAQSMTPAPNCPLERPADDEMATRSYGDCLPQQRALETAAEVAQKISTNARNPRELSQRNSTTVTGLSNLSSSCLLGQPVDRSSHILSEEEKSREARRKAGEAAILRALQADAQAATSVAPGQ